MIKNPILPGFYPDPSICRVGDDFYMITSSFSYYPGVPIFHSRDLVNWEQIGHVLDRPSQLPIDYKAMSCGIYAPTLRYHDGVYYMITTNVTMPMWNNFIVTATDPRGPWSEMHIIEGADGIDPSLFFDDDGKAYYVGNTSVEEHGERHQALWGSEIDLKEMKLVGERHILWKGAMVNCWAPEAAHIYKKDGWYYLMIAEGGTEHWHSVAISRCCTVLGKYKGHHGNPILTHRHLGKLYPICNVGHADLVELKDGSWYMVMLGSRLMDGYHKPLGRETFMAPVEWEDGWPVVSPGTGKVEWEYPSPVSLPEHLFGENALPFTTDTDFDEEKLGLEWNEIGTPIRPFYKIEDSCLKIQLLKQEIVPYDTEFEGPISFFFGMPDDEEENQKEESGENTENSGACEENAGVVTETAEKEEEPAKVSFLGRRLQHLKFEAGTKLYFDPEQDETAGIVFIQHDANQLRAEYHLDENGNKEIAVIITRKLRTDKGVFFESHVQGTVPVNTKDGEPIYIKVVNHYTHYSFYVSTDGDKYVPVAQNVDGSFLGSETCGGFIGTYIGLFATGGDYDKDKYAAFDYFYYKGER